MIFKVHVLCIINIIIIIIIIFTVIKRKSLRSSPIWKFFSIHGTFVVCKSCGKTLKGVKSTNAESHLACMHSNIFSKFMLERKKWRNYRETKNYYITSIKTSKRKQRKDI
ncbi:hypothetical protein Phum_PHUM417060 [Pediculus humanus corporis]|uniref:BED-type domain-containing protein n=1 Tax=Pediculus humanus subsp. corporis TaxID=121224 RepID=E0VSD1_PEDHC|nr:uncharacterized protein Phum_PHUM417060 [Pediculus humanus corporis]EEB16287.1 hypothetical protein Phum_PHUM417060 [Pediculus humanus corporis]